jgi:hypothetical protein
LGQPDNKLAYARKWVFVSKEYALLAAAARCALALQPISAAAERNWSAWGRQFTASRVGVAVMIGMKVIYVEQRGST